MKAKRSTENEVFKITIVEVDEISILCDVRVRTTKYFKYTHNIRLPLKVGTEFIIEDNCKTDGKWDDMIVKGSDD